MKRGKQKFFNSNKNFLFNKNGQMTIFIIAGILIIGLIAFYFIFRQGLIPGIGGGKEINPNSFLQSCLEEKISEAVNLLSMQGGSISPDLYKTFQFDEDLHPWNITYLCYSQNFYEACVNQEPVLTSHIEKEIKNYINGEVEICLNEFEKTLIKQNYEVTRDYTDFDVKLSSQKINLEIYSEFNLMKNGQKSTIKDFDINFVNTLYDLIIVAQEIASQESQYCYFNNVGYSLMYPKFQIDIYQTEGTKIYTIKWKDNQNKFRFAVRGCVLR